jgi:hypothetical protein
VRSLSGTLISPIAEESVTVVLVTTAECDRARFGIPSVARLQRALVDSGIAFRVVIRSRVRPARQYGRLLPDPSNVVASDPTAAFASLRTQSGPTLFVIDPSRRITARVALPVDPAETTRLLRRLKVHRTGGSG